MMTTDQAISALVFFIVLFSYFAFDYLRDLAKAMRQLSSTVKDESLKISVELNNICSAIKNTKKED